MGSRANTTFSPEHNGTNSSNTDKSKQIDVEAITHLASALNTSRAQSQNAMAPWWHSATPFGLPVDPEV
jgi:hypothetical protein